jgi:hypothetical protein
MTRDVSLSKATSIKTMKGIAVSLKGHIQRAE